MEHTRTWLSSLGFPKHIVEAVDDLTVQGRTTIPGGDNLLALVRKIDHPSVVIVTGTNDVKKDAFCAGLCVQLFNKDKGKIPAYIDTPGYSWSDFANITGHIVYLAFADDLNPAQVNNVKNLIRQITLLGNTVIMGVNSMDSVIRTYGEDFVVSMADRIKVIELGRSERIELKYL